MADIGLQCLYAFKNGEKTAAMELLSKVQKPEDLKDSRNRTLVHLAAVRGWHDMCQILVEGYHLSPTEKDINGRRPLHHACEHGSAQVVNYLLTLDTVMLTVNDKDGAYGGGLSALDRACYHDQLSAIEVLLREPNVQMPKKYLRSDSFSVLSLLSSKIKWSADFPVSPYFRVFMAGNSGAGKSTLTSVMINLDYMFSPRPQQRHGLVSGVQTLTAGVCPTRCSG